jgi:hypothetical protein
MTAKVIPFPKTTARAAARLFAFQRPPTVEDLLERARQVETLYETARTAQKSGAGWRTPPGGLEALRRSAEFFWERCVESVGAVEVVFAALERSGADEAKKARVRDHFSAFCHSL